MAFKVSPVWLYTGIEMPEPARVMVPASAEPGIVEIGGVEYAQIGRFDTAFSAGPGSLLEPDPEPIGFQLIERQWLNAITTVSPDHLAVVRVSGDSMVPTLFDNDWVLVDRRQQRFSREGVYALHVGEDAWIKRLSLNLRERLIRIISDNALYPLQELPEHEVVLIGRVISLVARRLS